MTQIFTVNAPSCSGCGSQHRDECGCADALRESPAPGPTEPLTLREFLRKLAGDDHRGGPVANTFAGLPEDDLPLWITGGFRTNASSSPPGVDAYGETDDPLGLPGYQGHGHQH